MCCGSSFDENTNTLQAMTFVLGGYGGNTSSYIVLELQDSAWARRASTMVPAAGREIAEDCRFMNPSSTISDGLLCFAGYKTTSAGTRRPSRHENTRSFVSKAILVVESMFKLGRTIQLLYKTRQWFTPSTVWRMG